MSEFHPTVSDCISRLADNFSACLTQQGYFFTLLLMATYCSADLKFPTQNVFAVAYPYFCDNLPCGLKILSFVDVIFVNASNHILCAHCFVL